MIENELRVLLTDRTGDLPPNARRVAEVRRRITVVRRRRGGAAALAIALVVLAGAVLTRLPGRPDALPVGGPTGVPAGPYFPDGVLPATFEDYQGTDFRELAGPTEIFTLFGVRNDHQVVVAACERAGDLVVRNRTTDAEVVLPCRTPVGTHFEGAVRVDRPQGEVLFAQGEPANVALRPGSPGRWTFGVLEPRFPEPLRDAGQPALLAGTDGPITVTIPERAAGQAGFDLVVQCVRGVRLTFSRAGRELVVARCEPAPYVLGGVVQAQVDAAAMTAAGLRPGDRVTLDVRSTGRRTDQWRVLGVG